MKREFTRQIDFYVESIAAELHIVAKSHVRAIVAELMLNMLHVPHTKWYTKIVWLFANAINITLENSLIGLAILRCS